MKVISLKISSFLLVSLTTIISSASAQQPAEPNTFILQPPKIYETDRLTKDFHSERRKALASKMKPKSVAVLFTSDVRKRSNDTEYEFKPDNNYYYLTGMTEPNSALIYVPDTVVINGKKVTSILVVPARNPQRETWEGRRLGVEGSMSILGADTAITNDQFTDVLNQIILKQFQSGKLENVYTQSIKENLNGKDLKTMYDGLKNLKDNYQQTLEKFVADNKLSKDQFSMNLDFVNVDPLVNSLRVNKTKEEQVIMSKVIDMTLEGHMQMMQSMEPGMFEYEVQAVGEYIFKRRGAEYVGYSSIAGSSENSTILHYNTNRRKTQDGDLMLVDMAAEFHGYSADVTRTFPVNGKFSPEQLAIYNLVLKAQQTGIDMIKPGVLIKTVSDSISSVLAQGLLDLGFIKEKKDFRRYTIHGYMHGIGLDVHDPYPAGGTFTPGYYTTVEPGIYIPENSPVDKKWWNIGVRIEDCVMVTETGSVNLSEKLPRDAKTIEKVMAKKGIGNLPVNYAN